MLRRLTHFAGEQRGASMVEFSIIAFLFFMLLGGMIDFSFAYYQWNSATKALQQGARLAATSDPVDSSLKNWPGGEGIMPGDPFPAFTRVCSGASGSCSGGSYSATAMQTIVFGRGQTACGVVGADQTSAMCDVFSRVQPQNVTITYQQTGLGFAGRPGGPVPTITVELTGLTYTYAFLGGLFGPVTLPPMKTTATGEDMCTFAPSDDPNAPCP
jgi:hypothetical protein